MFSIPLGFPAQRGTALRWSIPFHVGETPVLSSHHLQSPLDPSLVVRSGVPHTCPAFRAAVPMESCFGDHRDAEVRPGREGMAASCLATAFTSVGIGSIYLFMYFFKPCSE